MTDFNVFRHVGAGDSMTLEMLFRKYAAFGRHGHTEDITSMNYFKMMKDCGVVDENVNEIEIDIIFKK